MNPSLDQLPPPSDMPCYPCPHQSICCSWGASVEDDEEPFVRERYGDAALVWDAENDTWRTSIVDGKCFFLKDNACSIHAESFYPRICRAFPWSDGQGGPYLYDLTICPELKARLAN